MLKPKLPFSLDISEHMEPGWKRSLAKLLERPLGHIFSLEDLNRFYVKARDEESGDDFISRAIAAMGISYDVCAMSEEMIPESGPVVVVANHPFGMLDALLMAHFVRTIRKDAKIMANFLLGRVPEVRDTMIPVDPFASEKATLGNLAPVRQSIDWVSSGGCLCIFPSGTVSHLHLKKAEVVDPDWSASIARIIRRTAAPVVPIYFHGRNSNLFQAVGLIHPLLRTILLPREFAKKRGSKQEIRIGTLIGPEKLASFHDDRSLADYLKLRTYILANKDSSAAIVKKVPFVNVPNLRKKKTNVQEPLIEPVAHELLEAEINNLMPNQLLIESEDSSVYFARARQIPLTLREIGRLREFTFRLVQEGTGRSLDIDRFDNYYTHLFAWNRQNREIVGAYRLIKTDRALRVYGKRGLYTNTLFSYQKHLLEQMGKAIELGRSFIRPEYQKSYAPLLLLWKGIGHYALRHPDYRILFGTVSINNEYDTISRQLIVNFLTANNFIPELASKIKARNPMLPITMRGIDSQASQHVVKDLSDVSDLLKEIEAKHRSIPVLLRQYLKLGGKLLGFNLDPGFGDVLDGLIYVDLCETDEKLLSRFMGKDGARQFRDYHART